MDGGGLLPVSLPPLAPGQLGDRERLMQHISVLSATIARLQLDAADRGRPAGTSTAAASAAAAGGSSPFDPLVAQHEIWRLNKTLAQQSLLQEARENHYRAVEGECDALRDEREVLLRRNAELEDAANSMDVRLAELAEQLQSADVLESEVGYLRQRERELTEALILARSADPVVRVVRDGGAGDGGAGDSRLARETVREFEVGVAAARERLLLDMMFEPLQDAFVAGAEWLLSQQRWEEECIVLRDEALREQQEWLLQQQRIEQHDHQSRSSARDAELLTLRAELEASRQQAIMLQTSKERLERDLQFQLQRLEAKSTLFHETMQQVHDEVQEGRRLLINELRTEMEGKLKEAFRNGRSYERSRSEAAGSRQAEGGTHTNAPEESGGGGWRSLLKGGDAAAAASSSAAPSSVHNATLQNSRSSLPPSYQRLQPSSSRGALSSSVDSEPDVAEDETYGGNESDSEPTAASQEGKCASP